MQSSLDQFDSNESMLLMYLADELSILDRVEVERRLAEDPDLCAEFEKLQQASEFMTQSLASLDASEPLPGTASAQQRRLAREIKQWQVDRIIERTTARPHVLRRWWWMYPSVAAAVLVGFFIWWGIQPPKDIVQIPQSETSTQPAFPLNSAYAMTLPDYPSETGSLNEAEQELEEVAYLRTMAQ